MLWTMAVASLSVISYPGSKDLFMSVKLTSSGFVMHCIAYFTGMSLCYWAFDRKDIAFILCSGFLIMLLSVVLEIVQLYLPTRTFNVYDVAANGVGIILFVVIWVMVFRRPGAVGT